MKVSREEAEANRERVIKAAAKLFRERGYNGVGVANLMKDAGLTHGGFYNQFDSKEQLLAEACNYAIDSGGRRWDKIAASAPEHPLEAVARAYLSLEHRDNPGYGCVFAALGPDAARLSPEVKQAMTEGLRKQIGRLEALMEPVEPAERRQAALVVFASMVGALVLARAVEDEALSEEFLSAVHESITL